MMYLSKFPGFSILILLPMMGLASSGGDSQNLGLITAPLSLLALAIFVIAYALVMAEEFIHLKKSKPVVLAAGVIWAIVAVLSIDSGHDPEHLRAVLEHNLLEYGALLLFLLVAMMYINAMTDRNVFEVLRAWLINRSFGYRKLFWITGIIAFFLSPVADNLTTSLLMGQSSIMLIEAGIGL